MVLEDGYGARKQSAGCANVYAKYLRDFLDRHSLVIPEVYGLSLTIGKVADARIEFINQCEIGVGIGIGDARHFMQHVHLNSLPVVVNFQVIKRTVANRSKQISRDCRFWIPVFSF